MKANGRGSLLYKIDLSRAFRHIKLDPKDYNLLGLFLDIIYYDSYHAFWVQTWFRNFSENERCC